MHGLVAGELTEARVRVSEHMDTALMVVVIEHIGEVTRQHRSHLLYIVKEVGYVKYCIAGDEVYQIGGHAGSDIDGS